MSYRIVSSLSREWRSVCGGKTQMLGREREGEENFYDFSMIGKSIKLFNFF